MTKTMEDAKRIMDKAIINYGFESDYTIQIAISYEAFLNNPNEDTYSAFTMKACEMVEQAYADAREEDEEIDEN